MDNRSSAGADLVQFEREQLFAGCNRFIGTALFISWLGVAATSFFVSGKTWSGGQSTLHPHVMAALVLGFLVGGMPGLLGVLLPWNKAIPYVLAVGQMLLVGLLTHITGGRIETHFAYFGSLALLTSYREWRILVIASAVAAVDHLVRGIFLPYSIFGTDQVQLMRVVEHAFWVVWEDVFLIWASIEGAKQLRRVAEQAQQQKLAMEASLAQNKSLLEAAEALTGLSGNLARNTERLIADATASLGQAKSVSEQMSVVSGQVAEIDSSARAISLSVGETTVRTSQGDAAATKAIAEVAKLVESSQQISEVLDTVQQLVFQTNLLSINASIEAARAGEAGASFAVVAAEVRQLAEGSRESAETIAHRVKAIQSNVAAVGSRLSEICDSVRQISNLTSEINNSAQAQAATAATLNRSTGSVDESARQMVESMDGVYRLSATASDAASRTAELAEQLRALAEGTSNMATSADSSAIAA